MVKIALFCAAGMSTSMLVNKMNQAAQEMGVTVEIDAFPEAQMQKHLEGVAVALLGPQIKFVLPRAQQICEPLGIPVEVINTVDYGMLNGKKVLQNALKLAEK